MAHGVPGFSSIYNYFYVDTEPGGKELVAHGVLLELLVAPHNVLQVGELPDVHQGPAQREDETVYRGPGFLAVFPQPLPSVSWTDGIHEDRKRETTC